MFIFNVISYVVTKQQNERTFIIVYTLINTLLNQLNFHKREGVTYRVKNYLSAHQLKMAYLVINLML